MSTDLIQKFKQSYPDDGLRDYVRTKAVKAAAKKQVYYSLLFRENNITDYSQYRPIDIVRKIKELWDVKGEDYIPDEQEYNKIIYLNDKQKLTLTKNYEKEKEKLQLRERVKEEKKEKKEENKEKKPRGRPKKENITVITEDNNEQNKIEEKSISSSVENENIMEEQPQPEIKTKTTIKEDTKEKKRIEREEKKKIKEAEKQAAKELKKAEREKKKQEKEAEKQANKKKPGRPKKTTNIYVSDSDDNNQDKTEEEVILDETPENDEYLEEEVTVKMLEVDGRTFYYDSNDVLYDINTHEELGKIEELFPGYKKE